MAWPGRGAAWLARRSGGPKVASSNLAAPIAEGRRRAALVVNLPAMSKLASLLRRLRRRHRPQTEGQKAHDREADARADMLDGRGLSPSGRVMDFESDSKP